MKPYKVAVLQLNTTADRKNNLKCIKEMIDDATKEGAKLISLPEMMNIITKDNTIDFAESIQGDTVNQMVELSRKYNIWIHGGSIIEDNNEKKPYNTTFMISPMDGMIAKYRKIHLFDVEVENGICSKESNYITAGREIVTVKTEIGHLGFSICYDIRFPELFRVMALEGAQVIFTPANFTYETGCAHWESILRCRAIENGCYIIAAGQCNTNALYQSYGHSMIIDPWGEIVAVKSDGVGMIFATIDLETVQRVRKQIPSLYNRRDDLY